MSALIHQFCSKTSTQDTRHRLNYIFILILIHLCLKTDFSKGKGFVEERILKIFFKKDGLSKRTGFLKGRAF